MTQLSQNTDFLSTDFYGLPNNYRVTQLTMQSSNQMHSQEQIIQSQIANPQYSQQYSPVSTYTQIHRPSDQIQRNFANHIASSINKNGLKWLSTNFGLINQKRNQINYATQVNFKVYCEERTFIYTVNCYKDYIKTLLQQQNAQYFARCIRTFLLLGYNTQCKTKPLIVSYPNYSIPETDHGSQQIQESPILSAGLCTKCNEPRRNTKILSCNHKFCDSCITSRSCPVCTDGEPKLEGLLPGW